MPVKRVKVHEVRYHRNGSAGDGYFVARFDADGEKGLIAVADTYESSELRKGSILVLNPADVCDTRRNEWYADALASAMQPFIDNDSAFKPKSAEG